MRVAVLDPLRQKHGFRLKEIRRTGVTASGHAVATRLGWAKQDWVESIAMAVRLLGHRRFLSEVRAQRPWNGTVLEALVRVSAGLESRALILWSGGVYQLVKLLAADDRTRKEAVQYSQKVFRNLLFLEEIVAAEEPEDDARAELKTFAGHLMWQPLLDSALGG